MATALITGASSGIGEACAHILAEQGVNLILVARREEKLTEIKTTLQKKHSIQITVVSKDLATSTAGEELYETVQQEGIVVDYLINNAGFGGVGLFHEREWKKDKAMITLNILTLSALTRFYSEEFVKRGSGKILNVASVAGFMPGPLQATYFATKAFVLSFSKALMNELKGTGVSVTCLCPGATQSEFMQSAGAENARMAQGTMPTSHEVAQFGIDGMMKGKGTIIHGTSNKILTATIVKRLPRSILATIARKFNEKE